jgi:nitronate monooxygenase
MRTMELRVPILQAPVGPAAGLELARAVGMAGGMGSMPMSNLPMAEALGVASTLKAWGHPFFLNYLMVFGDETVRAVAALRPPAITFSWGMDARLIADVRAMGVRVGVQIGSRQGARAAVAAGADFLIAQGLEAGGHVQSSTSLQEVMKAALAEAGGVPVVAAGGIATGADIAAALRAGAQAVTMGTRFVATKESPAHPVYKQALSCAEAADTAFTACFDGGWPYAMHRVLRNSTLTSWEAAGCPAAPDRPGEGDIVAETDAGPVLRYSCDPPVNTMRGNVEAACLYSGTGVGAINEIEPAGPLVTRLWAEAQAILAEKR